MLFYAVLVGYFSLFFLMQINLTTADLGRHLINGRVFLEQGKIVSSNFYSYTQPDFPVITHHWFSGVIFYLVHSVAGFHGLSLFYILISGLTVFLFFKVAEKRSNTMTALLISVLLIPLMADRKEIRPEGFSYLLMGAYYYLLTLHQSGRLRFKYLATILIVLQVLWVNLHIFFIMGIGIVGAFILGEGAKTWFYKRKSNFRPLAILFGCLILASLINPYTLRGLLEPLNILKEYGYMIVENQTVFFMQKREPSFIYFFFELMTVCLVPLTLHIIFKKKLMRNLIPLVLSVVFMVLAYRAVRGIPIFAMFFVPLVASYLHDNFESLKNSFAWPTVFLVVLTLMPGHVLSFSQPGAGLGLMPGVNSSAEFVKANNIKGPIFNNYDIGGYLIYHFYGREKVFVDNRPEAYSVEFFGKLYGPMQEKEEVWQQALQDYNFNTIFFYRLDRTQWAQPFLIERIKDPKWAPVYVDPYALVLVRNNEQNKTIIEKYQIPQEVFVVN